MLNSYGPWKGHCWEYQVALANTLNRPMFIGISISSSDEYIRAYAEYIRDNLAPGLKCYFEMGNEVWNSGGPYRWQAYLWGSTMQRASATGDINPLTGNPFSHDYEAGRIYHAYRSIEMWDIFEDVFGGLDRLERVMGVHTVDTWWTERRVLPICGHKTDWTAGGPYWSNNVARNDIGQRMIDEQWTAEQTLAHGALEIPTVIDESLFHYNLIRSFGGKGHIAYEGGQHMVGVGPYQNNSFIVDRCEEANSLPAMEGHMLDYFTGMQEVAQCAMFCWFQMTAGNSQFGHWGHNELLGEDTPKKRALVAWKAGSTSVPNTSTEKFGNGNLRSPMPTMSAAGTVTSPAATVVTGNGRFQTPVPTFSAAGVVTTPAAPVPTPTDPAPPDNGNGDPEPTHGLRVTADTGEIQPTNSLSVLGAGTVTVYMEGDNEPITLTLPEGATLSIAARRIIPGTATGVKASW